MLSVILVFMFAGEALAAPKKPVCKTTGNGTERSPFTLCNAQDFELMRSNPTKHFQQGAAITLTNWTPIPLFEGSYNGRSYKLNLHSAEQGLFVDNYGTINNLVMNVKVGAYHGVAAISQTNYGKITNVIIDGSVGARYAVGGVTVWNNGTINQARVNASVGGEGGGIAAGNTGRITNSYVTGEVGGTYTAGGLVGSNSGTITNSHTWGKPVSVAAGTAGAFVNNNTGTITNSTATKNVYLPSWASSENTCNFVASNSGKIIKSKGTGTVFISPI